MNKGKIIAGIDIGTSKITTIIASQPEKKEKISVIGTATYPSKGLRRSQIVDIEEVVEAVTESVEAAERMAGYSIGKALVSIGGGHIESVNSKGVVAVAEPEKEITADDIERVIEAARAISLPASREIIHVIPRDYTVDSQSGIKTPLGMTGVRLEVETHIVTASSTATKNLIKCLGELGIEVEAFVFSGLASAYATLTDTEKDLGVCLVDIGGGTTSIAIFVDGSLGYSAVLPVGAKNLTNDLAIGLRVSLESAEKIKIALSKRGNMKTELTSTKGKDEEIDLKKIGVIEEVGKISVKTVTEGIIRPRLNEIFQLVGEKIKESGYGGNIPAGIVVTGGGAKTIGVTSSCKRVLSLPVRVGKPTGLGGLIDEIGTPDFATAWGLILYGEKHLERSSTDSFFLGNIGRVFKKIHIGGAANKLIQFIKSFLP